MAQDTLLGFPAHTLPYRCGGFTTLSTVSTRLCRVLPRFFTSIFRVILFSSPRKARQFPYPGQHLPEGYARHRLPCQQGQFRHRFLPDGDGQRSQTIPRRHRCLHRRLQRNGLAQCPGLCLFQKQLVLRPRHRLHGSLTAQRHLYRRQRLLRHDRLQRIGGKALVQQRLRILKSLGGSLSVQNHRDKLHPVPLRRGGNAIPGSVGGAGFQAGGSLIEPHQLIGVHQ